MRSLRPFLRSLARSWPPYLCALTNLVLVYLYTASLSRNLVDLGFTGLSPSQLISYLLDFTALPVVLCAQSWQPEGDASCPTS